jgi:class 3 adenylate cyclase/tetratricopeptide (TPR) repeat protein
VVAEAGDAHDRGVAVLRANLLGPFSITLGDVSASPWARPSAKRLCELLLVSAGRRLAREAACEALFPNLGPEQAANALSKALWMARTALAALGEPAHNLIRADRGHIWIDPECGLEVDLDLVDELLRGGLDSEPGALRDDTLTRALATSGMLLKDEAYEDWALHPRDRLEWARQEARLALARDRAKGFGRSKPEAVVAAWESCLSGDPTCEEAASALMQIYTAQQRWSRVAETYERCRRALEELGLAMSPALEEIHAGAVRDTSPSSIWGATTDTPRSPPVLAREERKLVSVLFADLASPPGVARLDPEDLREVIGDALAEAISQVESLGGTVTSVSGCGLAALFGAPDAHEDDPERAVRAGYRIVSAVKSSAERLTVRIGVESGPAVVGPIGGGGRVEYGAVGEVVALAAALQSVARSGSVLVGPATRAATEDSFEWGPSDELARPGGAKPLVACYLERPKVRVRGHLAGRRLAGQATLVGRDGELLVLSDSLREAVSGRGGIVVVVSEPGLGKTRLVSECRRRFMAWVGAGSGRLPLWLEGRGASYASSIPYGLYQQLLSEWIGVAPEEGEEVRGPALERAMRAVFTDEDAPVGLLGRMMGLGAGEETGRLSRLNPEELQRATFGAMRALVSRLSAYGPTVLVLEDLHWADPTSVRLTEEIAGLVREGPLLVLLTHRPEPDPGVATLEDALAHDEALTLRRVELAPLSESDERELARSFLGDEVPEEVVEAVCKGVEGNPLFLEERLSSLVETGAIFRDDLLWRLDPNVRGEVPEALERLIRSRVDRLGPLAHNAVVAASVLGVEFGLSALRAVTDLDGQLEDVVAELCTAGLLAEVPRQPERAYRFRHALMQEATYKGLLRAQQRQLHARVAWSVEESSSDRLEEVAALLGHHYAAAGESHRAVHHLGVAGDHAASVFANEEAISSYREALSILAEDPSGTDSASVELRAKLAEVLWRTGRHDESREMFDEALNLVDPEESLLAARLQVRLGRMEINAHRYDPAVAAFDAAEALLGEDPGGQDQARVDLWLELQLNGRAQLHYWRNEPALGMAVLEASRPAVETRGSVDQKKTFYDSLVMQQLRETRYRVDDEILVNERAALAAAEELCGERDLAWAFFMMGFCLLWRGELVEARERLEMALAGAERTGDVLLRVRALCYLNVAALRSHDADTVRRLAPQAMAAGEAAAYPEYVAAAKATLAWLAWQEDRSEDVVRLGEEALQLWGTTIVSYSWYWPCLWPMIAVRLRSGQIAEAIDAGRQLLAPPQQRLPHDLESLLQEAGAAWDQNENRVASDKLAEALQLAVTLGYA